MSVLLRRNLTSPPTGPVSIDRSHPLAVGLVSVMIPVPQGRKVIDHVRGVVLTNNGSDQKGRWTPQGYGHYVGPGSDVTYPAMGNWIPNNGVTLAIITYSGALGGQSGAIFSAADAGATDNGRFSLTNTVFHYGTSATQLILGSGLGQNGGGIVVTAGGRGKKIWYNGRSDVSQGTPCSRTPTGDDIVIPWKASNTLNCAVFLWDHELTDGDARNFSLFPWQFLTQGSAATSYFISRQAGATPFRGWGLPINTH